jgi:transcriptional regulator with GAF, ATPase, and Fis domain
MTTDISEQLTKRVNELEHLNRLAQVLSGTEAVSDTLSAIITSSQSLCCADRGSIVLFDTAEETEAHTIVRHNDNDSEPIDHTLNKLVAGHVLALQGPFVTENVITAVGLARPSARLLRLGPAMAVPLTSHGHVIGMIHLVNSAGGEQFTTDTIRVAEIVANMASQFIERAKLHESLRKDLERMRDSLARRQDSRPIIGKSEKMKKVLADIALVAPSSANVLIMGETGTGKELTAWAIHQHSPRYSKPLIAVNCAAIPADLFESELFGHERGAFTGATTMVKGKFELADGGTLFLDEISEMPPRLQPKLLRVLEEHAFTRVGSSGNVRVDVRLVAASSKDLTNTVATGEFSEPLFHRLNVVPILLPPLRERREDIPLLAQSMIQELSSGLKQFEPEALELLTLRQWRGNVRELRNAVERITIFIRNRMVSAEDIRGLGLHTDGSGPARLVSALREAIFSGQGGGNIPDLVEKELLKIALEECSQNITQAAGLIGIERMAFQRRMEKFGIQKSPEHGFPDTPSPR